jgi:hypothetical protein
VKEISRHVAPNVWRHWKFVRWSKFVSLVIPVLGERRLIGSVSQRWSLNSGGFYEIVPDDVRKQGPWQGQRRGDIDSLKPEYRLALACDGHMLVKCEGAVFRPEL